MSMRPEIYTTTHCDKNLEVEASFRRSRVVLVRSEKLPIKRLTSFDEQTNRMVVLSSLDEHNTSTPLRHEIANGAQNIRNISTKKQSRTYRIALSRFSMTERILLLSSCTGRIHLAARSITGCSLLALLTPFSLF